MKLAFEKSVKGRRGVILPADDCPGSDLPDEKYLRTSEAELPELGELDTVRHFTELASMNFSVDGNFYPLGSCTMKYNPKAVEKCVNMENFLNIHPMILETRSGADTVQGALGLMYELQDALAAITGMDATALCPLAGAHGEYTGLLIIKAYHDSKNNIKRSVIVPDESHGTNPASAAMVGYDVITVPTADNGLMDMESFRKALTDEVAAVIMTCPNTLGIYNNDINKICRMAHSVDALMYYDGANLNAILGKVRPGEMGFDVMHVNVHKTFATPHGGGGPGAGPVCVKEHLAEYLPKNRIVDNNGTFMTDPGTDASIGRISPFLGNFLVLLKAYAYILMAGKDGLRDVAEKAVLNANYMQKLLKEHYNLPYDRTCMHEFVLSASKQLKNGVHASDIAKYLIDRGIHPPTVYFPLIVKEAMMIEPTETESKDTIDRFVGAMIEAARLAETDPDSLRSAPVSRSIGRLDEVKAVREMDVCFNEEQQPH